MALSPEDAEIFEQCLGSAHSSSLGVSAITDDELLVVIRAARAQGRAFLEERVRLLEEGVRGISDAADSFRDCEGDFIAGQIIRRVDALLATPGERENG